MQALARNAEKCASFSAAVQARAKVSALRSELVRLQEEREAEAETDPLLRVQRLLRLATEAGSYTAAGGLAKLEAQLVAARELASTGANDGLEEATDEEILAMVTGAIMALPDVMVVQIRDSCIARLEGQKLRLVPGA